MMITILKLHIIFRNFLSYMTSPLITFQFRRLSSFTTNELEIYLHNFLYRSTLFFIVLLNNTNLRARIMFAVGAFPRRFIPGHVGRHSGHNGRRMVRRQGRRTDTNLSKTRLRTAVDQASRIQSNQKIEHTR